MISPRSSRSAFPSFRVLPRSPLSAIPRALPVLITPRFPALLISALPVLRSLLVQRHLHDLPDPRSHHSSLLFPRVLLVPISPRSLFSTLPAPRRSARSAFSSFLPPSAVPHSSPRDPRSSLRDQRRSHHSARSSFPAHSPRPRSPRSSLITPRSPALLVPLSPHSPRSAFSSHSSISSLRVPRTLCSTRSALFPAQQFSAIHALITPRSPIPAPHSSFPIPRSAPFLALPALLTHHSSFPRYLRFLPLLVPLSSFRFPAFTLSPLSHHSPLSSFSVPDPRSLLALPRAFYYFRALPDPHSSFRFLFVPCSPITPRSSFPRSLSPPPFAPALHSPLRALLVPLSPHSPRSLFSSFCSFIAVPRSLPQRSPPAFPLITPSARSAFSSLITLLLRDPRAPHSLILVQRRSPLYPHSPISAIRAFSTFPMIPARSPRSSPSFLIQRRSTLFSLLTPRSHHSSFPEFPLSSLLVLRSALSPRSSLIASRSEFSSLLTHRPRPRSSFRSPRSPSSSLLIQRSAIRAFHSISALHSSLHSPALRVLLAPLSSLRFLRVLRSPRFSFPARSAFSSFLPISAVPHSSLFFSSIRFLIIPRSSLLFPSVPRFLPALLILITPLSARSLIPAPRSTPFPFSLFSALPDPLSSLRAHYSPFSRVPRSAPVPVRSPLITPRSARSSFSAPITPPLLFQRRSPISEFFSFITPRSSLSAHHSSLRAFSSFRFPAIRAFSTFPMIPDSRSSSARSPSPRSAPYFPAPPFSDIPCSSSSHHSSFSARSRSSLLVLRALRVHDPHVLPDPHSHHSAIFPLNQCSSLLISRTLLFSPRFPRSARYPRSARSPSSPRSSLLVQRHSHDLPAPRFPFPSSTRSALSRFSFRAVPRVLRSHCSAFSPNLLVLRAFPVLLVPCSNSALPDPHSLRSSFRDLRYPLSLLRDLRSSFRSFKAVPRSSHHDPRAHHSSLRVLLTLRFLLVQRCSPSSARSQHSAFPAFSALITPRSLHSSFRSFSQIFTPRFSFRAFPAICAHHSAFRFPAHSPRALPTLLFPLSPISTITLPALPDPCSDFPSLLVQRHSPSSPRSSLLAPRSHRSSFPALLTPSSPVSPLSKFSSFTPSARSRSSRSAFPAHFPAFPVLLALRDLLTPSSPRSLFSSFSAVPYTPILCDPLAHHSAIPALRIHSLPAAHSALSHRSQ